MPTSDYRVEGFHDGDLVGTDTGSVYLLDHGARWAVPDGVTLDALGGEGAVIPIDPALLAVVPGGGQVPTLDISGAFAVDNADGSRTLYYAERGAAYRLEGTAAEVTTYFGAIQPLSALLPPDLHPVFLDRASRLSLAAASSDNWFAVRQYLASIAPPPITDPPGLSITTTAPQPATYSGENNVAYTVQVATQTIQNVLDTFPVASPVADAIWPGAIIQGNSLASGLLAPVQIDDRSPGTITVATELVVANPGAPTSVDIGAPTQATVTSARRQLLNDLNVQASAGRVELQIATMHDERQMSARLGIKLTGSGWNAKADVNASGSLDRSQTVLKLTQEFYTVNFAPTGSPARYFGDNVTVADLQQYSGPGNAPCYVSQVVYGRIALLTIESTESATEVNAKVQAAWQAAVSGDVAAEASLRASTASYNVQFASVGLTGATAFQAQSSLMDALNALSATASFGASNPGEVISYSVRYLLDGSVAKAVLGPLSYSAYVRADVPVESSAFDVWDHSGQGVPGGVNTGVVLRPGDRVTVTAFGQVWAGWWFGNRFGPPGDTSQHGIEIGNGTKPLDNVAFSALLYGFGSGWYYWAANSDFVFGETHQRLGSGADRVIGSATTPLTMYMHINDDNVQNGDGHFYGQIIVQRRALPAVGGL
jgi:Thiol-activated cytolysin